MVIGIPPPPPGGGSLGIPLGGICGTLPMFEDLGGGGGKAGR